MSKKLFLLNILSFFLILNSEDEAHNLNSRLSEILKEDPFLRMPADEKARLSKEITEKHPTYTSALNWFLWMPTAAAARSINWDNVFEQFKNKEELFYFISQLKYKETSIIDIAQQEKFRNSLEKIITLCEEKLIFFKQSEEKTVISSLIKEPIKAVQEASNDSNNDSNLDNSKKISKRIDPLDFSMFFIN